MAEPYPKSRQLARGERRYRRKVASPKQWQAIIEGKGNACRVCASYGNMPGLGTPEVTGYPTEYHHLIARSLGGDDVADNIVPLCQPHHGFVTDRVPATLKRLGESLSDAEYAYVVGKLGEGAMQRLFGV